MHLGKSKEPARSAAVRRDSTVALWHLAARQSRREGCVKHLCIEHPGDVPCISVAPLDDEV